MEGIILRHRFANIPNEVLDLLSMFVPLAADFRTRGHSSTVSELPVNDRFILRYLSRRLLAIIDSRLSFVLNCTVTGSDQAAVRYELYRSRNGRANLDGFDILDLTESNLVQTVKAIYVCVDFCKKSDDRLPLSPNLIGLLRCLQDTLPFVEPKPLTLCFCLEYTDSLPSASNVVANAMRNVDLENASFVSVFPMLCLVRLIVGDVDDANLRSVLARFLRFFLRDNPHINSLERANPLSLSDLPLCTSVKHLCIEPSYLPEQTNECLEAAVSRFPNVTSLNLTSVGAPLNYACLGQWPNLVELNFAMCPWNFADAIERILANSNFGANSVSIKKLSFLLPYSARTNDSIERLFGLAAAVESLKIDNFNPNVWSVGFISAATSDRFLHLRTLELYIGREAQNEHIASESLQHVFAALAKFAPALELIDVGFATFTGLSFLPEPSGELQSLALLKAIPRRLKHISLSYIFPFPTFYPLLVDRERNVQSAQYNELCKQAQQMLLNWIKEVLLLAETTQLQTFCCRCGYSKYACEHIVKMLRLYFLNSSIEDLRFRLSSPKLEAVKCVEQWRHCEEICYGYDNETDAYDGCDFSFKFAQSPAGYASRIFVLEFRPKLEEH